MVRYTAIIVAAACVALSACDDKEPTPTPTPAPVDKESTRADQTPLVKSNPKSVDEGVANAASVPPPLDLSYSEDDIDMRDFSEKELSRYQTEKWFKSQENGDKKLSVKPKIRIKEDATLEQTMGNYRDSLDGAEMGIEYKTR